jgi:hypothetical protein
MNFKPTSEEAIEKERFKPLEPGVYDFECVEVKDGESKAGNPQFTVKLKVFGANETRFIYDYLQPEGKIAYKLKHFCDSVGIADKYKSGALFEIDLLHKSGKVELKIQPGNAEYPNPKNTVVDYHVETGSNLYGEKIKQDFKDEEIPW